METTTAWYASQPDARAVSAGHVEHALEVAARCELAHLAEGGGQGQVSKYTRYMYNDDPLWQRGPHTRTHK